MFLINSHGWLRLLGDLFLGPLIDFDGSTIDVNAWGTFSPVFTRGATINVAARRRR